MNFVAVSGGADSTALALLLHERGEEFELCFADTGAELPETYWLLPRLASAVGRKLHVVSGGSFYQHLTEYGFMLPGVKVRWCTRVLKQVPQDRFYKAQGAEWVAIGIRADEPRRLHNTSRPGSGASEFCYPLAEAGMTKADVKALCEKHGLLHPAYTWRTNVSCFCCPMQRLSDWRGLMHHHPTLFAVAEQWEKESIKTGKQGYTWKQGWTLEAMRTMTKQQLCLWPEPEAEPCLICTL